MQGIMVFWDITNWQTFFMTHKQGGDEVEGLLSAKFEEKI